MKTTRRVFLKARFPAWMVTIVLAAGMLAPDRGASALGRTKVESQRPGLLLRTSGEVYLGNFASQLFTE